MRGVLLGGVWEYTLWWMTRQTLIFTAFFTPPFCCIAVSEPPIQQILAVSIIAHADRALLYRLRYSSDTAAIQRYSDTHRYTFGPALRIPDIKNLGKDLAPEELRILGNSTFGHCRGLLKGLRILAELKSLYS